MRREKRGDIEFMRALRTSGLSSAVCESINDIRKAIFEESENEPEQNELYGWVECWNKKLGENGLLPIDKNGKLIHNIDPNICEVDFHEGYARVVRKEDSKMNFINKDGEILLDQWFRNVGNFYDGYAGVAREDKKRNLVDKNGELLSKNMWFDRIGDNRGGIYPVECKFGDDNKRFNFINENGELLLPTWISCNDWFFDPYRNGSI